MSKPKSKSKSRSSNTKLWKTWGLPVMFLFMSSLVIAFIYGLTTIALGPDTLFYGVDLFILLTLFGTGMFYLIARRFFPNSGE